ncbi:MAG: hypothetical protein A2W31_17260 [Planctomycetes bacterium RBG_16_64_10]|nr:MAG: hypothetical protein A2W31_17260 [Planctomycetes bacterium RBG_16_64_10]
MIRYPASSTKGLLLSGGLDSAILLGYLLEQGHRVQPFYVRSDFVWQREELQAARRLVRGLGPLQREAGQLAELVVLDMPTADLYEGHWSVTGQDTPDDQSPGEAVYLPGHNALLLIKAALWCRLRGIACLALASLASNPFADASPGFFDPFQAALGHATGGQVQIVRPFETYSKQRVMELGQRYPLDLTFSCLAPVDGLHCGRCNKCAERRQAFRILPMGDPTDYASPSAGSDRGGRRFST